jgi:predicted nucleic acid-binding protein
MAYLVDTNVFLRLVTERDPDRAVVLAALGKLRADQEELCYTTQVLAEFWTVCTRPATARGGYGLSSAGTQRKAKLIERYCRLLPDSLATHQEWRRLIVAHAVMGVEIHDARLVATMNVHGLTHLLTINKNDFKRFPGITILTPDEVVNLPAPPSPPTAP